MEKLKDLHKDNLAKILTVITNDFGLQVPHDENDPNLPSRLRDWIRHKYGKMEAQEFIDAFHYALDNYDYAGNWGKYLNKVYISKVITLYKKNKNYEKRHKPKLLEDPRKKEKQKEFEAWCEKVIKEKDTSQMNIGLYQYIDRVHHKFSNEEKHEAIEAVTPKATAEVSSEIHDADRFERKSLKSKLKNIYNDKSTHRLAKIYLVKKWINEQ